MQYRDCIDENFINNWHPQYDETENDEPEYKRLVEKVKLEKDRDSSLSQQTFTEILNWKSARVKGRIDWNNFATYVDAIRKCEDLTGMSKMNLLVSLPGIGAPVASTFLQFIYPSSFPIIDRRTVDVLRYFNYIRYKSTGISQYYAFMSAILDLQALYPKWSLREIDRAIFSYHKKNPKIFGTLGKKRRFSGSDKCC